jgi:hypothetical protein
MTTQPTTNVTANVQSPFTSADMNWSFTTHGILMKDYKHYCRVMHPVARTIKADKITIVRNNFTRYFITFSVQS